jgi:hypothetical protein
MSTKGSNHSADQVQGAFGDNDQHDKGHDETNMDNDSLLQQQFGGKKDPKTSQKQTFMDNDDAKIDRKDD